MGRIGSACRIMRSFEKIERIEDLMILDSNDGVLYDPTDLTFDVGASKGGLFINFEHMFVRAELAEAIPKLLTPMLVEKQYLYFLHQQWPLGYSYPFGQREGPVWIQCRRFSEAILRPFAMGFQFERPYPLAENQTLPVEWDYYETYELPRFDASHLHETT